MKKTKFSILDLVPLIEGESPITCINYSVQTAQLAEKLGYERYWIAEHHNTQTILSSATVVLMGHLLQHTNKIRIGSGGIMLPNHTPLVVAEQIGTLATIYPDRVDLGLGRAPGTDQITAQALRRSRTETVHDFPKDVQELRYYLSKESEGGRVVAFPGVGTEVPIYLLGSSTFSAQLAAALGTPYAFASHFAPALLEQALEIYHNKFTPYKTDDKPYTMAGINVVLAETQEEAEFLASSSYMVMLNILRNTRNPLQKPVKEVEWSVMEEAQVKKMLKYFFIGTPETVKPQIEEFVARTQVDELIVSSYIHNQEKKLKSFELLAELFK